MIRNFLDWEAVREISHDGKGSVTVQNVFQPSDFQGGWDHAVRVVMPPETSIGAHTHKQNEEMYIILLVPVFANGCPGRHHDSDSVVPSALKVFRLKYVLDRYRPVAVVAVFADGFPTEEVSYHLLSSID